MSQFELTVFVHPVPTMVPLDICRSLVLETNTPGPLLKDCKIIFVLISKLLPSEFIFVESSLVSDFCLSSGFLF